MSRFLSNWRVSPICVTLSKSLPLSEPPSPLQSDLRLTTQGKKNPVPRRPRDPSGAQREGGRARSRPRPQPRPGRKPGRRRGPAAGRGAGARAGSRARGRRGSSISRTKSRGALSALCLLSRQLLPRRSPFVDTVVRKSANVHLSGGPPGLPRVAILPKI